MGESKQVKVDNWGIFFLQRLQTFFNKTFFCDLTLQFEDNVQLKVHRLVMNACTEYFQVLEQTCEVINDCLIMPPDLQADVVVPIVNFMYTGILEYQTSIFDRLYSTARLMNMTVLTKLLDAQKVPISPIPKPLNKRTPITPITWNLQGKKIAPKTMDPDLPEPLPGRKLPIWKRKSVPNTLAYRTDMLTGLPEAITTKYFRSSVDEAPKPTRFEWPDDDDNNFDTNSFDEISYTSKPIIIPQREKSPKPSTSNNFEELKRSTVSVKRSASPLYNDSKKVNIQDVKEYIKEQKLRSDYIDYDDSEAADNDLQTYDNDNDSEDENKDEIGDQIAEDTPNKSILKNDAASTHNKKVRFSLEGKENATKLIQPKSSSTPSVVKSNSSTVDMTNHTKIITEVLKKYPHLVKKNKNIRLKILAKGSSGAVGGTPVKIVKPTAKVSYKVMKPDQNTVATDKKKDGHWSCTSCSNPNPLQFDTYYLYRKHLTDVHNEKTDSQMCNICGHISRKQNLLIYHKYIKHNISPPASYHFPKCKNCNHVALSPGMLAKHQLNHCQRGIILDKGNCPTFDCTYCTKKFISNETLLQHIRNNHKVDGIRDNIITGENDTNSEAKKSIITAEEIDALEEHGDNSQQAIVRADERPKEKIKILSDVKLATSIKNPKLQSVKLIDGSSETQGENSQVVVDPQQSLEPSSEAESLSNVASGIAASLGLVNTIVVLDENQFILQSQDGNQENIIAGNAQNIILPDVSNINNIQNLVSQHQVITTDANTIISQAALNKNNITSTDELVMVLTDHDYGDAENNAVLTSENSNIVVLYSHPVQNQDGQYISQTGNLMINSNLGLVEVSNNYAVDNTAEKPCEESIELIQQEINNHMENENRRCVVQETVKNSDEEIRQFDEEKSNIASESEQGNEEIPQNILEETEEPEKMDVDPDPVDQEITNEEHQTDNECSQEPDIVRSETELVPLPIENDESSVSVTENICNVSVPENADNSFEEPMEIEESIEMIQKEINKNSKLEVIPPENIEPVPEDIVKPNEQELSVISEPEQEIIQKSDSAIKEENESFNDDAKENQEETNESIEDERMEVDSAKIIVNSSEPETEVENVEITITENIEDNSSDNIVPDLVKEKDQNLQEVQLAEITVEQPEEIQELIENDENIPIKDDGIEIQEKNDIKEEMENVTESDRSEEDTNPKIQTDIETQIQQTESVTIETTEICQEKETKIENNQNVTEEIEEVAENIESTQEIEENSENIESTQEIEEDAENIESTQEIVMETEIVCTKREEKESNKNAEEKLESTKSNIRNNIEIVTITNSKISNLLDDWDDGDTDSQQSDTPKPQTDNRSSINTLINDWEDEEET